MLTVLMLMGGGFRKHMPYFDNKGMQANDDEEEVDRDVKMVGSVEVEIMPQVVEINCKLSRDEKPFLRMKLFDICSTTDMNTNGYILSAYIFREFPLINSSRNVFPRSLYRHLHNLALISDSF